MTPEKLGKYPITGVLGEGAMGVVYKAFDPHIHRPVAIKTIHKKLIGDDPSGSSAAARFRNEAQAVGRLSHPGIVAIYEYGEDAETAYIAMEYVEGRTLSQILAANPLLPEADVLSIMDQLLDALACAHQHGVWHRDIKPANLIITATGQLKVTDFGIARIASAALTQLTSTIGTPGYMAPEQYHGEGLDHRVDVFASGVLLYRMLAGEHPFNGPVEAVMYKILNTDPVPPSHHAAAARPIFYDAIVAKALAKDPKWRFPSAAHFRSALSQRASALPEDAAETTVIVARTPPAPTSGTPAPDAAAGAGATHPSTAPLTGWDPAALAKVELALASFIGPVAKVLVRKAARTCADMANLTAAVVEHLPSDDDRTRFLTKLSGTPGTGRGTHATKSTGGTLRPPTQPTPVTGSDALTADAIEHARRVLIAHMGPIAGIVVKKASAQTQSQSRFFQLLSEHADEGPERQRLLAALQRRT